MFCSIIKELFGSKSINFYLLQEEKGGKYVK